MNNILLTIFSMSVSGALTALIIFTLSWVFRRFISQTWRYYIWVIVLIRLLLPFSPQDSIVGKMFSVFDEAPAQVFEESEYSDMYEQTPTVAQVEIGSYSELSGGGNDNINILSAVTDNIWLFWLCVSMVLFVQKTTKHYGFLKFIKSGGFSVTDPDILEIYNEVCQSMKITRPPKVYINKIIVSPLLVGIFKPFIVLPGIGFSAQQLRYVFRHELTHYRRKDVIYKWLSQIAMCVHWFNPLVYLVIQEVNKRCELSCDESVIRNMDIQEKQFYGDTLICALKNTGGYFENVAVATMNENIKYLKERLVSIMNHSPRTRISIVLSISLVFFILIGATYSGSYANNHDGVIESANTPNTPNTQSVETSARQEEPEDYNSNEAYLTEESAAMDTVLAGDGAGVDYDALGVKAYNDDKISVFTVVSQYMSKDKKTELFNKSYVDGKISFFSVLIDEESGVDYDALGVKAYNDDKISFFTVVSQCMSKAKRTELFNKSYEDEKNSFFSVLIDEELGVDYDTLGVKAYNDDKISFFTVVSQYMSKAKKTELYNKSYEDDKISFFSVLIDEELGVDYDALGVKAYNDDKISFFSVVSQYMSKDVKTEILNRAYEDNQNSFFNVLISELRNDVDIDAFMEKVR